MSLIKACTLPQVLPNSIRRLQGRNRAAGGYVSDETGIGRIGGCSCAHDRIRSGAVVRRTYAGSQRGGDDHIVRRDGAAGRNDGLDGVFKSVLGAEGAADGRITSKRAIQQTGIGYGTGTGAGSGAWPKRG